VHLSNLFFMFVLMFMFFMFFMHHKEPVQFNSIQFDSCSIINRKQVYCQYIYAMTNILQLRENFKRDKEECFSNKSLLETCDNQVVMIYSKLDLWRPMLWMYNLPHKPEIFYALDFHSIGLWQSRFSSLQFSVLGGSQWGCHFVRWFLECINASFRQ
jgi:hypothetical protein